jgi:inosose dehydratase
MKRRDFLEISCLGTMLMVASPLEVFSKAKPKVKWGIATLTWGKDYRQGIEEIAKTGIQGIQIRQDAFNDFKANPAELKSTCEKLKISIPILSGGDVKIDGSIDEQLRQFSEMARFVKSIGGKYLEVTTQKRDSFPPGKDKLQKISETLNLIGQEVKNHGIELLLRNQMHKMCQKPFELAYILENTDPKKVGFLLDIAHFVQAGGDPQEAIIKYRKRLKLLYIKDLLAPKPNHQGSNDYNYQFTELGKGNKINFEMVFNALKKTGFKDWCIIELDSVPNPKTSPLEASKTSLQYLTSTFGYKF